MTSQRNPTPVIDYLKIALLKSENKTRLNGYKLTKELLIHLNNDNIMDSVKNILNEMNTLKRVQHADFVAHSENKLLIRFLDALVLTSTYIILKIKSDKDDPGLSDVRKAVGKKWSLLL